MATSHSDAQGIYITRFFPIPPPTVYSAFTTPASFSHWFGTSGITVPLTSISLDVRVGEFWKATMILPDGTQKNWAGEYFVVDPPRELVFGITDVVETVREDATRVTVRLEEVDLKPGLEGAEKGTKMVFSQVGDGMGTEGHEAVLKGYEAFFVSMGELFEK